MRNRKLDGARVGLVPPLSLKTEPSWRACFLMAKRAAEQYVLHHVDVNHNFSYLRFPPLPLFSTSFTTSSCPRPTAHDSGVRSLLSLESRSTPFSSSSFTTASCPHPAAHNNGSSCGWQPSVAGDPIQASQVLDNHHVSQGRGL